MPDLGNQVAPPTSESESQSVAAALSRAEVLRRRSRWLRRLRRVYSDHYWCLMEELKERHRDLCWRFGHGLFSEDRNEDDEAAGGRGGNNNFNINNEESNENMMRCRASGCKAKAMALTRFCLGHILSDPKQVLYKPCSYQIKSSPTGPVICMKPIVRSVVPSLCPLHIEKAEKTLRTALRKAGCPNATTTNKIAPKCNVLVAETIRQIQSKRRAAKKAFRVVKTEAKDHC